MRHIDPVLLMRRWISKLQKRRLQRKPSLMNNISKQSETSTKWNLSRSFLQYREKTLQLFTVDPIKCVVLKSFSLRENEEITCPNSNHSLIKK